MNALRAHASHLTPVPLRRSIALAIAFAGIALLSACSVGAYKVDYFQEMHYSPAVRRQEPPVMNVPASAIAYQGFGVAEISLVAAPPYDTMSPEELIALEANGVADTPVVRETGAMLFVRNCSMCHGAEGDGQGIPLIVFSFPEDARPVDLTADVTTDKTDGAIFNSITNGQGVVAAPEGSSYPEAWAALTNMPSFEKLLTPEERWAIVWHIRGLQDQ